MNGMGIVSEVRRENLNQTAKEKESERNEGRKICLRNTYLTTTMQKSAERPERTNDRP